MTRRLVGGIAGTTIALLAGVRLLFARGTVLLLELPVELDVRALEPELRFDPRVGAWRAPAYRHAAIHRALAAAGITVLDEVPSSWPRPQAWPEVALRPYQEDALRAWERGCRAGVVVLPTGSGKTRVALAAMSRTRARTLCLAPTRALVEQWRREIAQFYPGDVGWYGDGERSEHPVTVATFESAARHMDRLGGRFDLLVVDECHHVGGLARSELFEMAVARLRLGLTATPPRAGAARDELARLVGPVVLELGLEALVGVAVASFEHVVLELDLEPVERRAYEADRAVFQPFFQNLRDALPAAGWGELLRAAAGTPEGRAALAAWFRARRAVALTAAKERRLAELLERHRDARVLVFTADNASACQIARRHLVMPMTSEIGKREREAALERFRRGELRALVSTRVLNEGLDVPDAEVAILLGSSGGEREYAQRIGRVLRPGPGKSAVVYEMVSRGTFETRQARRRREAFASRALGSL